MATSSAVRNRWNSKHYDRVNVAIPKGYAEVLRKHCDEQGRSMSAVVTDLFKEELEEYKQTHQVSEE